MSRIRPITLGLLVLLGGAAGCATAPAHQVLQPPIPCGCAQAVVFSADGAGNSAELTEALRQGAAEAGLPLDVEMVDWSYGPGRYLADEMDFGHTRAAGMALAARVAAYRQTCSASRIDLIGHSAGSAVVVHAAELLPPGSIERIILLSPALSPTYDLTKALRATKRQIVAFNSRYDPALHCTSLFGTADRVYCTSAGVKGFTQPAYLDDAAKHSYERLVQIPWTFQRLLELQRPWHNSPTMPLYLGRQVAPWLKDSPPSEKKPE